ncbi:MAG: permease [Planctomycetota bacterium]
MPFLIEFGAAFCAVLLESAPLVVLGFIIAGLLHEYVPEKRLRAVGGGNGIAPVARAVGVGALLPICSCSTIPLGVAMTRGGASIGTALAFMTTSPAVSPVTLVVGWGLLGPMLLGWYSAIAVTGALLLGLVGNRWLGRAANTYTGASSCGYGCGCGNKKPSGGRFAKAMRWALGDLGTEVSASLIVGLLVASLVLVALPSGLVSTWLDQPSWIALLAAVALSLPAYTCSVPSLVIAGSLLARGVDPGVAVAFLIAGPATNLGELNAIRTAMGLKAASFYAASLVAIAVAAGAATAWLPEMTFAAAHTHVGHDHVHALDSVVLGTASASSLLQDTSWWRWPFALLVVGIALCGIKATLPKRTKRPQVRSVTARQLMGATK